MGACCSSENSNKELTEQEIDLNDLAYATSESTINCKKKENELPSIQQQKSVVELLDTFVGGLPSDFTFTVPQHTLSKIAPQLTLHTGNNPHHAEEFNVNLPRMESMSEVEVKDTLTAMIESYYAKNTQERSRKQTMN